MSKKVTMQQIADELKISKSTVSRAFRHNENLSKELIEKVYETANKLGYNMNKVKSSLYFGIIATKLIAEDGENFYSRIYNILVDKFEKEGIITSLFINNNNKVPTFLKDNKVSGILFLGQADKSYIEEIAKFKIPFIFIDFRYDNFNIDSITTNNFFTTQTITNKLIKNGHEKIGYVGNIKLSNSIFERYMGYYTALTQHNIQLDNKYLYKERNDDLGVIDIKIDPEDYPTAFVCNSDYSAHLLVKKLKELNIKVPEDTEVIGFDNSFHSTIEKPYITTLEIDFHLTTNLIIDLIKERVVNPTSNYKSLSIEANLVSRQSTKNL